MSNSSTWFSIGMFLGLMAGISIEAYSPDAPDTRAWIKSDTKISEATYSFPIQYPQPQKQLYITELSLGRTGTEDLLFLLSKNEKEDSILYFYLIDNKTNEAIAECLPYVELRINDHNTTRAVKPNTPTYTPDTTPTPTRKPLNWACEQEINRRVRELAGDEKMQELCD